MFNIKSIFFIILSLLLISCQSTPPFNLEQAMAARQARVQILNKINAFQVNGSIAYFSDSTRSYGRFLIVQKAPNDYKLKLTSPIGTNILTLSVTPLYAELIDINGKRYASRNVESLMKNVTSINIPFNSLQHWLKGISTHPNNDKLDNSGRLVTTQFMQNSDAWQLNINDYMTRTYGNSNIDLPASIELRAQHERVRLTISNWILR